MVVDYRADIWSLGVILYECLAGTRPIEGDDLVQVVTRLVSVAIMPLERIAPELPHDVSSVVMQMLTRDPLRRPADLAEVSKLLATYTRVVAPPFGAPSTGKSWAASGAGTTSTKPSETRPGEPVPVAATDPRGPTLLSSTPPVPSSVTVVGPDTRALAGRSNKPLLWLAAGALAVVAALLLLVRYGSSHDGPGPGGAQPSEKASAGPVVTVAPSVAPLEPVNDAAAPVSSPATSQAHKVAAQRTRPAARAAAVPLAASHAPPPPEVAVSKPPKDENTLFSGRK
jgi:serine/threonine-protein kinase